MSPSIKTLGIDQLTIDERLALVEEIWDSIASEAGALPLTNAQHVELEERIAEDNARPEDVIPGKRSSRPLYSTPMSEPTSSFATSNETRD